MRFRSLLKSSAMILALSIPSICATKSLPVHAADFTITNGQTVNATQSIGAGANETGTVEEGGTVSTVGNNNSAVTSSSAGGTITNSGTVSTTGDTSYGINVTFITHNNTVTNDGSITTAGDGSIGVFFFGNDNTLTQNGTITTSGDNAHGVLSNAASDNTITNNGTITTNGTGSHGIILNGTNNTIVNNGTVIANGTGAALRISNISGTIINQGYATSVGGNAIELSATDTTLVLKPGSLVEGTVLFDGGGNRILQYDVSGTGRAGGVLAITGAIAGAPTTTITNTSSLASNHRVVQSGNIVAVITPDQFGSSQKIVTQTLNDAGNILNNRQQLALLGDTTEINAGTQYAASTTSMNDSNDPNEWALRDRKVAWAEVFGSYQERGQTSDTSDTTVRSGGFLTGVDFPQTSEGIRAGVYIGGFGGDMDIGTFRDIDSLGILTGGYIGKNYDKYYMSGGLNLGFSENDSTRSTGVDTASSDYKSYFISPSLTVMRPIEKENITLVPNLTLRYTAQHDDSYTESGSVTNQSVDSRTVHSLDAKAMVEARLKAKKLGDNSELKPAFRAGVRGQTIISGNETDVTVLNTNLSFDPKGGDNIVDGILGMNLNLSNNDGPNLYFDAEANLGINHGGPGNNKGILSRIGLKWKF